MSNLTKQSIDLSSSLFKLHEDLFLKQKSVSNNFKLIYGKSVSLTQVFNYFWQGKYQRCKLGVKTTWSCLY